MELREEKKIPWLYRNITGLWISMYIQLLHNMYKVSKYVICFVLETRYWYENVLFSYFRTILAICSKWQLHKNMLVWHYYVLWNSNGILVHSLELLRCSLNRKPNFTEWMNRGVCYSVFNPIIFILVKFIIYGSFTCRFWIASLHVLT